MEMNQTLTSAVPVDELAAAVQGDVVAPGDAEWDLSRRAWNLAVDQLPALVALPADVDDVVAIVDWARTNGLKIAPQGTGHNASAMASLEDTVLLSTQKLRGVEIDVETQTARVAAGTHSLEVTEASSPHGLFPLSGSASTRPRAARASAPARSGRTSPRPPPPTAWRRSRARRTTSASSATRSAAASAGSRASTGSRPTT